MTSKYSLLNDLKERTCRAINFTFLGSHLLLGIILFSGLGIWIELFKLFLSLEDSSWKNLRLAFVFYPPAVFGASGIYLLLTNQKRDMRTLILILASFLGIATFALSLTVETTKTIIHLIFNVITALVALWVWILANSPNKELHSDDHAEPDASTGGSTNSELSGDASEFKTED